MAKYHITKKGEPGPCRALKGKCPFGGEGDHYPSREEAQAAFEKMAESSSSLGGFKKGGGSDGSGSGKAAPANGAPSYNFQEARSIMEAARGKTSVLSSTAMAKLTPGEWGAVAEAYEKQVGETKVAAAQSAASLHELGEKHGVFKLTEERQKLLNDYHRARDSWNEAKRSHAPQEEVEAKEASKDALWDAHTQANRAVFQAEALVSREPTFTQAAESARAGAVELYQTAQAARLARIAQHLTTPRHYKGQEVPPGHDTFKAYYDLDAVPLAPTSPSLADSTFTVTNSRGEPVKLRPSTHRDPAKRAAANRSKGFMEGVVIAPAVATLAEQDSSTMKTTGNRMDLSELEGGVPGSYDPVDDVPTVAATEAMLREIPTFYRDLPPGSVLGGRPQSRVDMKRTKEFPKIAVATVDDGMGK